MSENLENHSSDDGKVFKRPEKSWTKMSKEQRDEVYQTHKEALAGDLKVLRENLGTSVWEEIASPDKNYAISETGKTISSVMLKAFTKNGNLGERTPREVMFYSLDYLQNASENQGRADNIDQVEKDDTIEIYNESGRWKLRVTTGDGTTRIDAYLFPPKPEVKETPSKDPEPIKEEETKVGPIEDKEKSKLPLDIVDLQKFKFEALLIIDPTTKEATFNMVQIDQLIGLIKKPEIAEKINPEWYAYLVNTLEHFRENIDGQVFTSKTGAIRQIVKYFADAMSEALPESDFSHAVKEGLKQSIEDLKGTAEAVGSLATAVDEFKFTQENWDELEGVLKENIDYFKNHEDLKEIGKEGGEAFDAATELGESIGELDRVFPEQPHEASLAIMPGYPGENFDIRSFVKMDETGKLKINAAEVISILEDPEKTPGLSDDQRALYIQVTKNLEDKLKKLEGSPANKVTGVLIGFGESIKEALPGSKFDQSIKNAFEKVAEGMIKLGKELGDFMRAIEKLKESGKIEELSREFYQRVGEMMEFFKNTSPYKEILEAFTNVVIAFEDFNQSFGKVLQIKKAEDYMESQDNYILENYEKIRKLGVIPFRYFGEAYKSDDGKGKINMKALHDSIPESFRAGVDDSLFDQDNGKMLYEELEKMMSSSSVDDFLARYYEEETLFEVFIKEYAYMSYKKETTWEVEVEPEPVAVVTEPEPEPEPEPVAVVTEPTPEPEPESEPVELPPAPEPEVKVEPEVLSEAEQKAQRLDAFQAFLVEYNGMTYDFSSGDKLKFEYIPKGETTPITCKFSSNGLEINGETYKFKTEANNLRIDLENSLAGVGGLAAGWGLGGLVGVSDDFDPEDLKNIFTFKDIEITSLMITSNSSQFS